jgi:hypothetical protein
VNNIIPTRAIHVMQNGDTENSVVLLDSLPARITTQKNKKLPQLKLQTKRFEFYLSLTNARRPQCRHKSHNCVRFVAKIHQVRHPRQRTCVLWSIKQVALSETPGLMSVTKIPSRPGILSQLAICIFIRSEIHHWSFETIARAAATSTI